MNNFDNLFFRAYTGADSEIREVFHRHYFIIIEDIVVWVFFGIVVPGFLYSQDIFSIRSSITPIYSYFYMTFMYLILMYKLFDWYVDTWIMTESMIVSMRWKWFSSDILYIPYKKIEGIEIRTQSWWAALLGMSDVVVKLAGDDEFMLSSADRSSNIVAFLQDVGKGKKGHKADDREPFEILVESLSSVVKGHLATNGRDYITKDYLNKLDETLVHGIPIDLRSQEEKEQVKTWKERILTHGEADGHDGHEDSHSEEEDHHGHH
ncbi:MAG: hypothetical protein HHAS10_04020 [Candidatus Altimarinota bacterium]